MATNIATYFRNRPPRAGGGTLAPPTGEDLIISIFTCGEAPAPNFVTIHTACHIISVRCCGGRSTKGAKNATECCFVVALVSVIVSAAGCPLFEKYYVGLLLSRHLSMVGAMNLERRAFLAFLSAALAVRSIPTNAQPATRLRTIGVLMGLANDEETQGRAKVIEQGLAKKGWIVGQNLRIEYRFAAGER